MLRYLNLGPKLKIVHLHVPLVCVGWEEAGRADNAVHSCIELR